MQLPVIDSNFTFIKTKLPSGKIIGVRGWRVKDEKDLLFAMDMEDNMEDKKINHLISFLRECTDNTKLFDELGEQDIKKIAIEVRKLSKGNTIEYRYICPHCGSNLDSEVNLSTAETVKTFDLSPAVINQDITITFKDLSFKQSDLLYDKFKNSEIRYTYYFLMSSVEGITYKGETYTDFTAEQVETFLDPLDSIDMAKIYDEFEKRGSAVNLTQKITCTSGKCRKEINVKFGEFFDFLIL